MARLLILAGLLTGLGFWVASGGSEFLTDVRQWVASLGSWGPLVFALCYALAVTVPPLGVAAVLVGATTGSRTLVRTGAAAPFPYLGVRRNRR